jgi:hypothetical protein
LEAKGYGWLKTDQEEAPGTFASSLAGAVSSSPNQD